MVPREAYTTPCSPADCTKSSKSEGRAFAGAAVRAPTETIWGAMGSALVVAQSECSKTRAACLLDFEYEYGGMAYFCLHTIWQQNYTSRIRVCNKPVSTCQAKVKQTGQETLVADAS